MPQVIKRWKCLYSSKPVISSWLCVFWTSTIINGPLTSRIPNRVKLNSWVGKRHHLHVSNFYLKNVNQKIMLILGILPELGRFWMIFKADFTRLQGSNLCRKTPKFPECNLSMIHTVSIVQLKQKPIIHVTYKKNYREISY